VSKQDNNKIQNGKLKKPLKRGKINTHTYTHLLTLRNNVKT